jgi:hypothetical protein
MADDILKKLRNRQRPTLDYALDLEDNTERLVNQIKLEKELPILEARKLNDPKNQNNNRRLARVKKDIETLKREIDNNQIKLRFQALEPAVYDELNDQYYDFEGLDSNEKLTDKEKEAIIKKRDRLFMIDLISLCSVTPKMDAKYVAEEFFPTLTKGEQLDIGTKLHELNARIPSANIPKEFRTILD